MNKLTTILTSIITLVVFASCQKEVIQPNINQEDSSSFVMKNDDYTSGGQERSSSNSDANFFDDNKPSRVNSTSVVGDILIKIDNITDPNNDEDEKGKVGLNK